MDWIVRQENLHQEFPSIVSIWDGAIFGDFRICIIHPAQTLRYIFWKKHADFQKKIWEYADYFIDISNDVIAIIN